MLSPSSFFYLPSLIMNGQVGWTTICCNIWRVRLSCSVQAASSISRLSSWMARLVGRPFVATYDALDYHNVIIAISSCFLAGYLIQSHCFRLSWLRFDIKIRSVNNGRVPKRRSSLRLSSSLKTNDLDNYTVYSNKVTYTRQKKDWLAGDCCIYYIHVDTLPIKMLHDDWPVARSLMPLQSQTMTISNRVTPTQALIWSICILMRSTRWHMVSLRSTRTHNDSKCLLMSSCSSLTKKENKQAYCRNNWLSWRHCRSVASVSSGR